MRCFTSFEIRASSFVLGEMMLIWSAVVYLDYHGRLSLMLDLWGAREIFSLAMGIAGLMMIVGSIFPMRKLRHAGLWLTPLVSFPAFMLLAENNMIGLKSISLPVIGIMSLVIFFMDAKRKPRYAQMDY